MIDFRLSTPSSSTIDIVTGAHKALDFIYRDGFAYKKAGVILMGISEAEGMQPDLFEYDPEEAERRRRLDETVDRINRTQGHDTVTLGSQIYDKSGRRGYGDVMRHEHRSPARPPAGTTSSNCIDALPDVTVHLSAFLQTIFHAVWFYRKNIYGTV